MSDDISTHSADPAELVPLVALLRATLESTTDAILVIGVDGEIKLYNQKFLSLWNLSEARMKSPREAVPCMSEQLRDPEAFLAAVRAYYARPEDEGRDLLECKDGRIIERHTFPLRLDGRVVGRAWNYRDVTARVREEHMRDSLQREKIEALEQADRLKNQFLSILSHELRTPINAILGFGSVLQDGLLGVVPPEQARYVGKILDSADLLLGLVDDLLDMSRIQAGKLAIEPAPLPFDEVVQVACETLAPLAERKGQHLALQLEPDLPAVLGDRRRIVQVLLNLVGNAIKYTPAGSHIVLEAARADGQVICRVRDDGAGIAPGDAARIFAPFTQGDMSNTRSAGGVGLGLAIAKALVEAHGGEIGLESQTGQGSVFWFRLPVAP
ncbi:MAG TPA: ATP-binding protein [Oscillatoriaceae cyanobacterium]